MSRKRRPTPPAANDPATIQAIEILELLAPSDESIALLGEPGVGKELWARWLHKQSKRSGAPFVAVNCGAIPESMIEAELFGYAAGAFTGAVRKHLGYFAQAEGGTLFLDEIADLILKAQASLLRVLETGDYYAIGDSRVRHADVRIVCATNRPLKAMVEAQTFREDLYWRVATTEIRIPPLRERPKDFEQILDELCEQIGIELDEGARRVARDHTWPGNARELRSRLMLASVFGRDSPVRASAMNKALGKWPEPDERLQAVKSLIDCHGSVASSTVADALEMPLRTARHYLANWAKEGELRRTGEGPQTRYLRPG